MTGPVPPGTAGERQGRARWWGGPITSWRGPVLVTGTDTGVGKTIATAALAATCEAAGVRVAVLKPAQTGDDDDAATVAQLAAPTTVKTLACYPDPLAPLTAARVAGLPPVPMDTATEAARDLAHGHDLVLVEGAGGLLVPMGSGTGDAPWTVADLAVTIGAPGVVVVRPDLGTLNHTALTVEALGRRGVPAVLVIGSWPPEPELVHRTNLRDLATIAPVIGRIPAGAATMPPAEFRRVCPGWLSLPA